ncbi:tetratricopeptide repeat protein [Solicola gregarius]|uniref:Tetratricopeptide repeat protein n=1 Tax=Solicola gregarius TaxID=2908642 RepID=A0AA46YJN6_9ACTN|nr:tetratricopeptide repeat protein [Solicola gregarius]UYM03701.1 tetratricopeptide repeat protein [Solicola gregarius]
MTERMPNTLDAAIDAERLLLDPAVRADRVAVEALLHPDFTEIGASGRSWSRAEIIEELAGDTDDAPAASTSDFAATWIADDTVLVTYASSGTRDARRSSIWQRVAGAWQVRFHQGTPAALPHNADDEWDERVAAVWTTAGGVDEDTVGERIAALVAERPDEPRAAFELASAHDFCGDEATAIGLYERALRGELDDARRQQAVIQLASSLRIVGRASEAVAVLESHTFDATYAPAAQGFSALAQRDAGHPTEAVRTAVRALATTRPAYANALETYADER